MTKKKFLGGALIALPLILAGCDNGQEMEANGEEAMAEAPAMTYEAAYTDDGALITPENWREWIYIGTPVTPNGINGGAAPFPETHSVYIDPTSWAHWKETGTFREGTMLAKELSMLITEGAYEDGSTDQVSGRGFFQDGFSGLEFAIKDSEHYPDEPGNWAYYSSGHAPGIEYPETMTAQPAEACNSCHEFNASDDWVFLQFYPVLSEGKGGQAGSE